MSITASFAEDFWVRRAFGFAGYTFLVWDHILTFEREITYIWKAPWTISKGAFLINRYGNIASQTFVCLEEIGWLSDGSQTWCQRFKIFGAMYALVATESVHILVLMRAWAIWGCTRRMAIWLLLTYTIYFSLMFGMTVFESTKIRFQTFQYLSLTGVCVGTTPKYVWFIFILSFSLDAIVFILTTRSLRRYSRSSRHLYPSTLIYRLFKDIIIFFLACTADNMVRAIMWTVYATRPQYFISITVSVPFICTVGQRLVLNLRGLQAHTYTTGELSREVDRQMMAFISQGDDREDHYAQPIKESVSQSTGTGGPKQGDGDDADIIVTRITTTEELPTSSETCTTIIS
ncbi:hypothetical protein BJ138DRAFT_1143700 [Hygrophoropsis aurantiaca]|uniref:Uncharacterized protein n=1 Tax=Hygrophoropsis aurantiaca TaxID=72124 RepID=A0ACB8AMC8_9AGAM|nr:hypothetical protein BJ138DRAFT_1143700 [Hygrophoropsis aurantiaca]